MKHLRYPAAAYAKLIKLGSCSIVFGQAPSTDPHRILHTTISDEFSYTGTHAYIITSLQNKWHFIENEDSIFPQVKVATRENEFPGRKAAGPPAQLVGETEEICRTINPCPGFNMNTATATGVVVNYGSLANVNYLSPTLIIRYKIQNISLNPPLIKQTMKTINQLTGLIVLLLFGASFNAKADKYVVTLDANRASYSCVIYTRAEMPDQTVNHRLDCTGPGSTSCCWPFIVAPSQLDCVAEYSDIFDYIMNEIVNNNQSSGEGTWGDCHIPISWSVTQDGTITIEVDSDTVDPN
jgi:hypothetical protein